MNSTTTDQLAQRLRAGYATLFHFKEKPDGLIEVGMPHSTLTSKFVSVFVSDFGGQLVVSDGGWLADGYGLADGAYFQAEAIAERFGVSSTTVAGVSLWCKVAESEKMLTSVMFDVAQFIQLAVNIATLAEDGVNTDGSPAGSA